MKRQPIEWEKVFVNNPSDKGIISEIHRRTPTIQEPQQKQQTDFKVGIKNSHITLNVPDLV